MEVFTSALGAVLTLFVFMAGGYVFARWGLVKPDFSPQLSGVVFKFFFPLMLLKVILLQTDIASVVAGWRLLVISTALIALGIPLGKLVAHLMKGRIAVAPAQFATMFPNYIFMGMPVILAMYGEIASATLVMYSLPMSLLVSTLGYMVMASTGGVNWRAAFNPCTVAIVVGLIWLALGVPVPGFVAEVITLGNNVVSPVAMFQVGMVIASFKFQGMGELRDAALFSALRLVGLPLVVAVVLTLVGLRGLEVSVPAMVTAMPVAANMTITAGAVGRHEEISGQLVFVSTVLSLITIPLMAVVVDMILGLVA